MISKDTTVHTCGTKLEINVYHRALALGARWYCSKCDFHIKETPSGLHTILRKSILSHKYRDRDELRSWLNVAETIKQLIRK